MTCTCSGLVILLVLSHQHSDYIELFKCTVCAAALRNSTFLWCTGRVKMTEVVNRSVNHFGHFDPSSTPYFSMKSSLFAESHSKHTVSAQLKAYVQIRAMMIPRGWFNIN